MVLYLRKIACLLPIRVVVLFLVFIGVASCNLITNSIDQLPYYGTADLTPIWEPKVLHRIGKFELVDQNGNQFKSSRLNNKIYVANFFFTICPSICPRMTKNLKILQDSIADEMKVEIVSFSVMPWVDSVKRLKAYAEENKIDQKRWHLLTGKQSIIYSLGRTSFFADDNSGTDTSSFIHTDKMYLIDQQQRIRGVYNATNPNDIGRVLEDIRLLKSSYNP